MSGTSNTGLERRPIGPVRRAQLDKLMTLAEARMDQADLAGDDDAWIKYYMIWLFLYSVKNGLPWPRLARQGERL